MIRLVKNVLRRFGADLIRYERDHEVAQLRKAFSGLLEISRLQRATTHSEEAKFLIFLAQNLHLSKSQILQDLFVLYELQGKRNGYFVEFGATDGIRSSNSFLLESQYDWSGILAEPGMIWHEQLQKNRRSIIDYRCVWYETGRRVEFNQVSEPELSTIKAYSHRDRYGEYREDGSSYLVETVNLNDLLRDHNAPLDIDYLSVDTEGSEYAILSALDFEKFQIRVITCEHNYTDSRQKLFSLLTSKGYVRKFELFSQVDVWYVRSL
jgi:FkbM family methyltransferase